MPGGGAGGEGGGRFFLSKVPGEGGLPGREVPGGREGVCGELGNLAGGGGGAQSIFLFGAEMSTKRNNLFRDQSLYL